MGFFSKLFGKKKKETFSIEVNDNSNNNQLIESVKEIKSAIDGLGFVSQKD